MDYLSFYSVKLEYKDSRELIALSFKKNRTELNGIMSNIYNVNTTGVKNQDYYCARLVKEGITRNMKNSIVYL